MCPLRPRLTWPAGDDGYSVIKLPSGEQRLVLSSCMATIGVLSNPQVGGRAEPSAQFPCLAS